MTSEVLGLVRRIVTVLNQVCVFFEICGRSVFLCTCLQLTIQHEPFNKQLGVKMSGTSFSCGNLNGNHNTELTT